MDKNTQSRKWQLTINNPIEKGYCHDVIVLKAREFKSLIYMCLSDEIGAAGTFHTHVFLCFASAVRFSTLLNRFEGAHFEMCNGTAQENRDYIFKEGKYLNSEKGTTNIRDSHLELGELPVERSGRQNKYDDLFDMIAAGMSNYDILKVNPDYVSEIAILDKLRFEIFAEKYKKEKRTDLEVIYVYGPPNVGKSTFVFDNNPDNYVVPTYYKNPFDGYSMQNVMIFDEFEGQFPITLMNRYIDIFPMQLDARYSNKWACYHKVFIISNIDFKKIYKSEERSNYLAYHGFLRRIHKVIVFTGLGKYQEYVRKDYIKCISDNYAAYSDGFEPASDEQPFEREN